ncbi:MAG: alanine--tRNA ligase, partial [Betaproteobacteria bacterium]|nr:alanine--tRNA ligase [Betaproteobacteria bacterium]
FNAAMARQQESSRAAGKFKMDRALDYAGAATRFHGYEQLRVEGAHVTAIYAGGTSVSSAQLPGEYIVVLDDTPFYAESGGQVGDAGWITAGGLKFDVRDTQKIQAQVFGHHGTLREGTLKVGDVVTAQVDGDRRAATMRNHSVTHLMHKALREVLGPHVQQKGSLVDADKTRFDFAHNAPMTEAQIADVEQRVNTEILQNSATEARVMPIDAAQKLGAMMLFGEKYGDEVRVLDIGSSRELCGGTHVQRTGDIGLFKVVLETAVASGVRRIEAVTGLNALAYVRAQSAALHGVAQAVKAPASEAVHKVQALQDSVRALEKQLDALKGKLASSQGDDLAGQAVDIKGVK